MKRLLYILLLALVAAPAWALSGWSTEYDIAFNSDSIGLSGDVTNHPSLVHIDSSHTEFWNNIDSTNECRDVRFTKNDGSTLLDFETESCDTTAQDAWFWVKIPTLSSSADTTIKAWVGNASPSDGIDGAVGRNPTSVWSSYIAVYHFSTNHPQGKLYDSTGNGHNVTEGGTPAIVSGQIDEAYDLESADADYLTRADNDAFSFTDGADNDQPFSVTGWFNPESDGATKGVLLTKYNVDGEYEWSFWKESDDQVRFIIRDKSSGNLIRKDSVSTLPLSTWSHFVGTYDGSESLAGMKMYFDGSESSYTDTDQQAGYEGMENTTSAFEVGRAEYSAGDWLGDGIYDEIRVSGSALSGDWVKASHASGERNWLSIRGPNDAYGVATTVFSDDCSSTQGANGWTYEESDGTDMTWVTDHWESADTNHKVWCDNGGSPRIDGEARIYYSLSSAGTYQFHLSLQQSNSASVATQAAVRVEQGITNSRTVVYSTALDVADYQSAPRKHTFTVNLDAGNVYIRVYPYDGGTGGDQQQIEFDFALYPVAEDWYDGTSRLRTTRTDSVEPQRVFETTDTIRLRWEDIESPANPITYKITRCSGTSNGMNCNPTTEVDEVVSGSSYDMTGLSEGRYTVSVTPVNETDWASSWSYPPDYGAGISPHTWSFVVDDEASDPAWQDADHNSRNKMVITAPTGGWSAGDALRVPFDERFMDLAYHAIENGQPVTIHDDAGNSVNYYLKFTNGTRLIGGPGTDNNLIASASPAKHYSGRYDRTYYLVQEPANRFGGFNTNSIGAWIMYYDDTTDRYYQPWKLHTPDAPVDDPNDTHFRPTLGVDNSGVVSVVQSEHQWQGLIGLSVGKTAERVYDTYHDRASILDSYYTTYAYLYEVGGSNYQCISSRGWLDDSNATTSWDEISYGLFCSDDGFQTMAAYGPTFEKFTYLKGIQSAVGEWNDNTPNTHIYSLAIPIEQEPDDNGDAPVACLRRDIVDPANSQWETCLGQDGTFPTEGVIIKQYPPGHASEWETYVDPICNTNDPPGATDWGADGLCNESSFWVEESGYSTSGCMLGHSSCYRHLSDSSHLEVDWVTEEPIVFIYRYERVTEPSAGDDDNFSSDCAVNPDCISISSIDPATDEVSFGSDPGITTGDYFSIDGNTSATPDINGTRQCVTKVDATTCVVNIDITANGTADGNFNPVYNEAWYRYTGNDAGTGWNTTEVSDVCAGRSYPAGLECRSINPNTVDISESRDQGLSQFTATPYYRAWDPIYGTKSTSFLRVLDGKFSQRWTNFETHGARFYCSGGDCVAFPGMGVLSAVGESTGMGELFIEAPSTKTVGQEQVIYYSFGGEHTGASETDPTTFMPIVMDARFNDCTDMDTCTNVTVTDDAANEEYYYEIAPSGVLRKDITGAEPSYPWVVDVELAVNAQQPTANYTLASANYQVKVETDNGNDFTITRDESIAYILGDGTNTRKLTYGLYNGTNLHKRSTGVAQSTEKVHFRFVCTDPGTSNLIGSRINHTLYEGILPDGQSGPSFNAGGLQTQNRELPTPCGNLQAVEINSGADARTIYARVVSYRFNPDENIVIHPTEHRVSTDYVTDDQIHDLLGGML